MEKHSQMGCMSGFLQIHQILSGKRLQKRLPAPPKVVDTVSMPEDRNVKQQQKILQTTKETPRLSLDSRATTDANGCLHPKDMRRSSATPNNDSTIETQLLRSPSLIAKLMGLDPLPDYAPQPERRPQLMRSSSESRVSPARLVMAPSNCELKQQFNDVAVANDPWKVSVKNVNEVLPRTSEVNLSSWIAPQHRRSFFDSADVFPEPNKNFSRYGDIDKRLRGIDEPTKDLETLKNILEALQLKGLLHSTKPPEQSQIYRQNSVHNQSQIVVMKPSRISSMSPPILRKTENEYSPSIARNPAREFRHFTSDSSPMVINKREKKWSGPIEFPSRPNSSIKPKPLNVEGTKEFNVNNRVYPSRLNTRRTEPDVSSGYNRPTRCKKTMSKDYQKENNSNLFHRQNGSSSISGSSMTTSTDADRGRNLLERCDKLLHSIAEMAIAADIQPSPVSVLDDAFNSSPSKAKRKIHLQDCSLEDDDDDDEENPKISAKSPDYLYVSEILNASNDCLSESDVFLLLEKRQQLKGKDFRMQRKVVFDTINEILSRIRRLPPWENVLWTTNNTAILCINKVWQEFQRICVKDVLKKEFAITGDIWKDCPMEMSEMVLNMERLIFKDLITETIWNFARETRWRRKLGL